MDIGKDQFYPLILDMLDDIADAHFVAFDLELSGVPSKNRFASKPGKQSLQERYLEIKEAAERYHILQIGLTCVQQDVETEEYVLKPYNFSLSPLVEERGLNVERIFSFQSGAVEFLQGVNFDFNQTFADGVPYLSRKESREAREKHARRQDRSNIPDIDVKATDTESLLLMARARDDIEQWKAEKRIDPLDIVPVATQHGVSAQLTGFQKRLIHQLVHAEFPDLVTLSIRAGVRIILYDKERETNLMIERKRELEQKINHQKGLRWLIEALHGGNVIGFDFREVARNYHTGNRIFSDTDMYKGQLHRAQERIKGNPRVLVGHNCLLDLVYIYKTFIDDLPDTVEQFQACVHKLWPVIVDTKYMFTHNCEKEHPASSLEHVAELMNLELTPTAKLDKDHERYDNDAKYFHEAGYDSYITAQVAVKLSAKLARERDAAEKTAAILVQAKSMTLGEPSAASSAEEKLGNGSVDEPDIPQAFTPSIPSSSWKRYGGDPTLAPFPRVNNRKHHFKNPAADLSFEGGMPRWSDDFWKVYGNKMRVFGTNEGICVLDMQAPATDSEDGGVRV